MGLLYVVNCTGQNFAINYRIHYTVDDQGRPLFGAKTQSYRTHKLEARKQDRLHGELSPDQMSDLIGQIEKSWGAVHIDDIRTAKAKGVVKILYAIDKKIPIPILKDVIDHNLMALTEQGRERRRRLALVADAQLSNLVASSPNVTMEFENEDEDEDVASPTLEEGIRIQRKETPTPKPKTRRKAAANG